MSFRTSLAATLVLTAGLLAAAPAQANPTIDAAKRDCVVGERIDGYLGIIDNSAADEAVRREVRDVNQRRTAAYQRLATQNGVTVAVTAKITAEKLINNAPSGHCVQNEQGGWVRVP